MNNCFKSRIIIVKNLYKNYLWNINVWFSTKKKNNNKPKLLDIITVHWKNTEISCPGKDDGSWTTFSSLLGQRITEKIQFYKI